MIRYAARHKTELGFKTAQEVQDWIDNQVDPTEWHIVATTKMVSPHASREIVREKEKERLKWINHGEALEKQRMRNLLGLG